MVESRCSMVNSDQHRLTLPLTPLQLFPHHFQASPDSIFSYTDRTARFFPPFPPPPQGPDSTPLAAFDFTASSEPGAPLTSGILPSKLHVLSSADNQGLVCLHALGSFLIGKVKLREVEFQEPAEPGKFTGVLPQKLRDAEVLKVSSDPLTLQRRCCFRRSVR